MHRGILPLAALTLGAALWLSPAPLRAQSCERPRVMLVVDRSSSMERDYDRPSGGMSYTCLEGMPGSKWAAAQAAIERLVSTFGDRIDFGLALFPYPNACAPGRIVLPFGRNDAIDVLDAMRPNPGCSGSYTPLYQTFQMLSTNAQVLERPLDTYVVLITDGVQWCYVSTDEADRYRAVGFVQDLSDNGVDTFVVGYGAQADRSSLHRMAIAGDRPRPGCNDRTDAPASGEECFYFVDSPSALEAALEAIGRRITSTMEECDGVDNDCDGLTDEGLGTMPCGGACGSGVKRCVDGDWGPCEAPAPAPETCDGVDNDCDGVTDEGCGGCRDGETRPCGSTLGMCVPGTQTCRGGSWSECEGGVLPRPGPDDCDGLDSDCDALVDEDANCPRGTWCLDGRCIDPQSPGSSGGTMPPPEPMDCRDGETRPCGVSDIGPCRFGTQRCVGGRWDACTGNVDPFSSTDPCDAVDNDCDGFLDEDADCPSGQVCVEGRCEDAPSGAEPTPDAGGPLGPPEDGGCACRLGDEPAPDAGLLLVPLLGLLLWRRRASGPRG